MIPPYVFDKATKQVKVNDDFVELYPNQAAETFTKAELKEAGHTNLTKQTEKDDGEPIQFKGEAKNAIQEIVRQNGIET